MGTYLDRILDRHRAEAAADERRTGDLVQAAGELPPTRGFRGPAGGAELAVISEVKRRSPSKGDLFAGPGPRRAGRGLPGRRASCLSVR